MERLAAEEEHLARLEEEELALALEQSRLGQLAAAAGAPGPRAAGGLSAAWTAASEETALRESLREAHGPKPAVPTHLMHVAGDVRGTASELVGLSPEDEMELAMLKSRIAAEQPPGVQLPGASPSPPMAPSTATV